MVKARRKKPLTALSGDFLSSLLVVMAFLFIGPPECTLVQRGEERESKTVHVKLPRQHNVRKRERFFFFFFFSFHKRARTIPLEAIAVNTHASG